MTNVILSIELCISKKPLNEIGSLCPYLEFTQTNEEMNSISSLGMGNPSGKRLTVSRKNR